MADGQLVRLTITPFDDSENVQSDAPAGPPFTAQFNPESFTVNSEIEFGPDKPAHGDDGEEAKFEAIKPRSFAFDFLLDGTGAAGQKVEVSGQIEAFKATVGFAGNIHRPRFLVLNWGTFIATCVIESFSLNYKLFRPDGTPLRVVLSASFREHKPKELKERTKNLQSPDILHAHLVKEGEHLSLITHRVYKDPHFYLQVAEANGLDTVRTLQTGSTLYLPPVR